MQQKKRLLIAERTNFMQMKQSECQTIGDFAAKLRDQAVRCEFNTLKDSDDPSEELVKMQLIAGVLSHDIRNKILEKELTAKLSSDQVVEFVQQIIQVQTFVNQSEVQKTNKDDSIVSIHKLDGSVDAEHDAHLVKAIGNPSYASKYGGNSRQKCPRCGGTWHNSVNMCPAFNLDCRKCGRKGHFA